MPVPVWWSEHREQFHPSDGDTAVSRSHRRLSQHHLVAMGGFFWWELSVSAGRCGEKIKQNQYFILTKMGVLQGDPTGMEWVCVCGGQGGDVSLRGVLSKALT